MSHGISLSLWLRMCVVGSLLFAQSVSADPPILEEVPQPRAVEVPVPPAIPPQATNHSEHQIQIKAIIYEVDPVKFAKLADQSKDPVTEFLKQNGFQLSKPDQDLPVGVCAVSEQPASFDVHGQDVTAAFERISAPQIRTINGQEASVQVGSQIPIPTNTANDSTVGWRNVGLKLTIIPHFLDENLVRLNLQMVDTRINADSGAEIDGVAIPSLNSRKISSAADLKSGQYMLIATCSGKSGLTQFVQLSTKLIPSTNESPRKQPLAESPRGESRKKGGGTQILVSQPSDVQYFAPSPVSKPSQESSKRSQDLAVAVARTDKKILANPPQTRIVEQIEMQVRVYEIDPNLLTQVEGQQNPQEALNQFFQSLKEGRREVRLDNCHVSVWSAKKPVTPDQFGAQLGKSVQVIAEKKVTLQDGQPSRFDYGGTLSQIKLESKSGSSISSTGYYHLLATPFSIDADVTENNRIRVCVAFDAVNEDLKKPSKTSEKPKKATRDFGVRSTAELVVGQTLCVTDVNPSNSSESLLITITPELINRVEVEVPVATVPEPKPVAKTTIVAKEIVVEDRWPISEIKLGQRVVVAPFSIGKTSLSTNYAAAWFASTGEYPIRVARIETLSDGKGRKVTLTLPTFKESDSESAEKFLTLFVEMISSATTNSVIPAEQFTLQDFRWLDDVAAAIDPAHRPLPVELLVGENFVASGIQGVHQSKETPQQVCGPFILDFLDNDGGGFWKVTAAKTGMTRLIQFQQTSGREDLTQIRRTEYLVKVDTRELERHLSQHFPTSKVTVTSIGTDSLMLSGTAASQDDYRVMMDMASQFTPKVLSRLKFPAHNQAPISLSNQPVEQTRGIENIIMAVEPDAVPASVSVAPEKAITPATADEFRQLRMELREMRQEFRDLIQRLDREQPTSPKGRQQTQVLSNPRGATLTGEKSKLRQIVDRYNTLMQQKRFAEAELTVKLARDDHPERDDFEVMWMRAVICRRIAEHHHIHGEPVTTPKLVPGSLQSAP